MNFGFVRFNLGFSLVILVVVFLILALKALLLR